MLPTDLCTLEQLRAWLGQEGTGEDPVLGALISGASADIYAYLNRSSIMLKSYVEIYDKVGNNGRLMLKNYPVIASTVGVVVNGQTLAQATTPGLNSVPSQGWLLETWDGTPPGSLQSLTFITAPIIPSVQGIVVSYSAGYTVLDEAQTIPGANGQNAVVVNAASPYGPWGGDIGVSYANGTAFTRVAASETPAAGEYKLGATPGEYVFDSADEDEDILISYSYIPQAINQACVEIAAERFKYKTRIGESNVTMGGIRTTSYRDQAMTPYVKDLLNSYKRVVPFA